MLLDICNCLLMYDCMSVWLWHLLMYDYDASRSKPSFGSRRTVSTPCENQFSPAGEVCLVARLQTLALQWHQSWNNDNTIQSHSAPNTNAVLLQYLEDLWGIYILPFPQPFPNPSKTGWPLPPQLENRASNECHSSTTSSRHPVAISSSLTKQCGLNETFDYSSFIHMISNIYNYIYSYTYIFDMCVCVFLLPLFYPKWWNTHAEKAGMQQSKSPQTVPLVQATHNGHGAGNANAKGLKQQWNGHRHLKPASCSSEAPHTDWTWARIGISQ